jgi:aconitate hydratase
MGVLPLQFAEGEGRKSLGLTGEEEYTVRGLEAGVRPGQELEVEARRNGGDVVRFKVVVRVNNETEVEYLRHGGVLSMVLRQLTTSG